MSSFAKDIFREIKGSFGRFFAIFAISAIGVAFFAGISACSYDMKYTADNYFDQQNLFDYRIVSPTMFTEEQIEKISQMDMVENVYATNSFDLLTVVDNKQMVAKVHGYSEDNKVNNLILMEGRMPQNKEECVILYGKISDNKLKIGDTIELTTADNYPVEAYLSHGKMKIVGIVKDPYYVSYQLGSSDIGNGSVELGVYVKNDAISLPMKSEIFITVEGANEYNSYKEKYFDYIEPLGENIEAYMEALGSEWYILDRNSHYSYVDYEGTADRMDAIAKVFPLFFILVAALVCLTTMTRMVEEQRGLIGTYKALGYSGFKISMKYIIYAATASSVGGIAGAVAGMYIFPVIVYNSWNIMYVLPEIKFANLLWLAIVSILGMALVIIGSTVFACIKELTETPALLMRPKAPKIGKKILLERISPLWSRMTFSHKVTARNLFRYKKRFFMTVIGISGCTALLIAGFGLKDSISYIITSQFEEVFKFDGAISYVDENMDETLKDVENIENTLPVVNIGATFESDEGSKNGYIYLIDRSMNYREFINPKKRGSNKQYDIKETGVILSEKMANDLELKVGDKVIVEVGDKRFELEINAICEMYVGHYMFADKSFYESVTGEKVSYNTSLVKFIEADDDSTNRTASIIRDIEGVTSISLNMGTVERFQDMISVLGLITLVLIICAALLSFVVLYNLTNVNISERLREIATIKVLGFYDNEVSSYVYRENVILTFIGGAFGILLGLGLHAFIMKIIEMDDIMFGRRINFISYLLSYGLTILFTLIINGIMNKKLKNIPMVESLKSVE